MQLIDTHTHIYLPDFDADRDDAVNRAVSKGVIKLLMPNIDAGSVKAMLAASERYKNICYPMIGLHPTSVKEDYLIQLESLRETAAQHSFIAVGEIGIDLYWDKTYLEEQKDAFSKQVICAVESGLPIIIHSRDSIREIFSILSQFKGEKLKGIFHAFSGDVNDALKAIEMGFMLGIGGPLTFKNSRLSTIVKEAGLTNLVLETDSPYLTPVPYRGKRNESSYICIINSKLAEIFDRSEEEVANITFDNSCRLFNICSDNEKE